MMENIPDAPASLVVSEYQEQLWLLQQQQPEQCFKQLRVWRLRPTVDLSRLIAAIQSLINAAPALNSRLLFSDEGDLYLQHDAQALHCLSVLHAPHSAAAKRLLQEQQAAPWDAQRHAPFQALLVLTEEECWLGLLLHRLLEPQFSPEQLLQAIQQAYGGQSLELPLAINQTKLPLSSTLPPISWLRSGQPMQGLRSSYANATTSAQTQHWHCQLPAAQHSALQVAVRFALHVAKQGQQPALGVQVRQGASLTRLVLGPLCTQSSISQAIEQQQDSDPGLLNNPQLPWLYIQLNSAGTALSQNIVDSEVLLPSAEQRPDLELQLYSEPHPVGLRLSCGPAVTPALAEQLLGNFVATLTTELAGTPTASAPAPASSQAVAQAILQQFRQALDEPQMQLDDDFFDFGGHSLLATRIIGKLHSEQGICLQFNDFFSAPSARQLAACAQLKPGTTAGLASAHDEVEHALTEPTDIELSSPLALAQATLWGAYKAFDFGKIFNLPFAVRFLDPVDERVFQQAFNDLLIRHASLRTLYGEEHGVAYQRLVPLAQLDQYPWFWPSAQSVGLSPKDEAQHQFDLTRELPLRVRFFTDSHTGQQSLSLLVQHMAIDEWSLNVMLDELAHAYSARLQSQTPQWPSVAASFHDFARQQQREGINPQHLRYWTQLLGSTRRGLQLPGMTQTPTDAAGVQADWRQISPTQSTIDRLYSVARAQQSSLFGLIYSAIALALHKLGDLPDVLIGTSASGRTDAQYHQSVGYFTTMVAHPVQFNTQHSVAQLIRQVSQTINSSMAYADVPLAHIQQALGMTADDGLLFDVYVQIHADNALNGELRGVNGEPIRYRQIDPDKTESMFGLQFEIMENFLDGQRCLRVVMTHRLERYPHALAIRICQSIEQMLSHITEDDLEQLTLQQLSLQQLNQPPNNL